MREVFSAGTNYFFKMTKKHRRHPGQAAKPRRAGTHWAELPGARKARKSMRCARTDRAALDDCSGQWIPALRFAPIGFRDDEGAWFIHVWGGCGPKKSGPADLLVLLSGAYP